MATQQTPTNPVLSVVDNIMTGIIYGVGVEAAIVAATAQFPFLGWPIIGSVFRAIVQSIAGKVFMAIKPFVNFNIIKFQNDSQKVAYESAIAELQNAHEKGDADAVKKATDKAKSTLDDLINFNH